MSRTVRMAIALVLLLANADRASAKAPDISLDWVGIYEMSLCREAAQTRFGLHRRAERCDCGSFLLMGDDVSVHVRIVQALFVDAAILWLAAVTAITLRSRSGRELFKYYVRFPPRPDIRRLFLLSSKSGFEGRNDNTKIAIKPSFLLWHSPVATARTR